MLAAVFERQNARLSERQPPAAGPADALVRVSLAGICNTDLELHQGYYGFSGIPGHEFVGVVEQAPGTPDLIGKRVVADINCGCGACLACLSGDARHCPDRTVLGIMGRDGCFAEQVALPAHALHTVPAGVPDEAAVFAEPLAAALEISQQVHLTGRQRVAILGDGKLGLLCALALCHFTPNLTLVGKHGRKLTIARNAGVVTTPLEPDDTPLSLARRMGQFDVVVEATGKPNGLEFALALTRPEGAVVAKTTSRDPSRLDLAALVVNEIRLLGSRCGDMALALHFLNAGRIDPAPLIEAVYPFVRFEEALAHAARPGALKVLLRF